MLSSHIRRNLKSLLLDIGKHQKQLEVLKQILCEQYDFEPYSAFQRLDADRKGYLTALDIKEFLNFNDLPITEEDASLFIRYYATEDPNLLAYQDFLPALLPLENPDVRAVATQRKVYAVNPGELLPYEVEYALARVLAKEIAYHHNLNPIKEELASQDGFSPNVVFASLDPYNTGFIDDNVLKEFFKANGSNPSVDDLIAILRRIDKDCDGKINYEEFLEAIKPLDLGTSGVSRPKKSPEKSLKSKKESGSALNEQKGSATKSLGEEKSIGLRKSPVKTFSNDKSSKEYSAIKDRGAGGTAENFSGSKKVTLQDSAKKGLRSAMKRTLVNELKRQGSPERDKEGDLVENLLRVLREIVNLEREIEIAKEDLSIRTDFNLFDTFRLFDRKGAGIVTAGEIEQGLNELGIYPTKEDLYLFVRKFDRDADAKLKFSDFCDGLIPIQPEYIKMLKSRNPINTDLALDFKHVFSQQTLRLMKALLLLHLENESVVEALRQKLARDPRFDTHKIFDVIDQDEDGFISIFELRSIMEKYNMFITDKDLTYLISRFDKTDKQKISYIEFVQEITPKSPKKY